MVLSLAQETRKQIYAVLAKSRENSNQQEAIAIPATTVDKYFGKSGLSEDTISLVKRLCYPHGRLLLFADMPTILDTPPTYFFRDPPDAQYTDVKIIRQKLETDCYPVFSDPRYGDLVFLTKPNGEILYSTMFLADTLVYTKNGGHFSAPWMLTTLPELVEAYSAFTAADEPLKVLYYRNKYY